MGKVEEGDIDEAGELSELLNCQGFKAVAIHYFCRLPVNRDKLWQKQLQKLP